MSKRPRPKVKAPVFHRPTENTRFFIDYDWWERSNLDLKTYLYTRLNVGEELQPDVDMDKVDVVDPRTAEVHQVDGFQYVLQTYFSQQEEDFASRTSLVDAAFSVLLANANQPMTAQEIAERVQRPTEVVLKTLGGPHIYQGIRPLIDEET